MVLAIECAVAIALFTAVVVPSTAKDPLAWIGDYPPAIRRRCEELGLVEAGEGRLSAAELARKAVGVVVLLAALAIVYLALRHSADALNDEIGRAEQRQEMLEQDLQREQQAWDRMRSQRNLIVTLRNNGIAMNVTPHGRRIAMGGFVRPAGGAPVRAPTAVAANF